MRRGYPARMGLLWIVQERASAMNVLFLAASRIFMSSMLDIYRRSCYSIRVKQALLLIEGVFIA